MNSVISRRAFLHSSAALAAGVALAPRAFAQKSATRAYVGTYTGSDGRGEGIYLFDFDPTTGALANRRLAAATVSPSWIALHPSKRFLYAVNEGGSSGSVAAFAVEADGSLHPLNSVSSRGAAPCHLSFDPSGKFALVANYMSGTFAVLPIHPDGTLGEAADIQKDAGVKGAPNGATHAPRGSNTVTGHDAPHAHFIHADANGRYILTCDLGQDRIDAYRLDVSGKLLALGQNTGATLPNGDGPRHLAFHTNGKWVYLITEQASTVTFFHYNEESAVLTAEQTLSTLPDGFAGTSYGSEILIHPNGKWLYAANRLHDSIAVFSIGPDGHLTHTGQTHTEGDYPRHMNIDPSGRYFFVCNQRGDNVPSFHIHPQTGLLAPTGQYAAAGTPACILFA